MAESFLERIVAATCARLAERQASTSLDQLREEAARQSPALDFAAALRPTDGEIAVIAEIKRASPSKGVFNSKLHVKSQAGDYARGGAAAISVLTEQDFFQGSLDDLRSVKQSRSAQQIPVLRKDFITDPYQVVEARAAGADSYLLIVALLDDRLLSQLIAVGRELGMEPLVEVHDAEEALRAVKVGATIIGVNARDLRTFEVNTTLLRDLRLLIPADRVVVAESGIATTLDAIRMRAYGTQAILVGEALVRAQNPMSVASFSKLPVILRMLPAKAPPIIKLCGMRTPEDAMAAYQAGADMISVVLTKSKRQVTPQQAGEIIAALPSDALTVGVFADEPIPEVERIAQEIGVKAIQIAVRPEKLGITRTTQLPTIVAIPGNASPRSRPGRVHIGYQHLAMIESAPSGVWGGTGKTGDWQLAAAWSHDYPIILAGGLTPANVAEAIRAVQPWGVDVSSGIENADGQKDPARMRAFVQAVRVAAEEQQS